MPNQIILFYDDNDAADDADDDVGDDVDDKNVDFPKLNNALPFCHHADSRFKYYIL